MGFWDGVKIGEGWRPEKGEKIAGTVAGMVMVKGQFGEYPMVTIRTSEGEEMAVHAFHSSLKKQLKEAEPRLGDDILIAYDGTDADGRHLYKVGTDKSVPY